MIKFTECASLNVSFNVQGIATISYTVVSDTEGIQHFGNSISFGGQVFTGYITNAYVNQIPNSEWYESHISMVAETAT